MYNNPNLYKHDAVYIKVFWFYIHAIIPQIGYQNRQSATSFLKYHSLPIPDVPLFSSPIHTHSHTQHSLSHPHIHHGLSKAVSVYINGNVRSRNSPENGVSIATSQFTEKLPTFKSLGQTPEPLLVTSYRKKVEILWAGLRLHQMQCLL